MTASSVQKQAAAPELLLAAAKELFAKQGFDGTTVKDVADRAKVNVSLVSYHFGGKRGLYLACLDQFGQARLDVARRLLTKPRSLEEFSLRLEMFITEFVDCLVAEPELTKIVQRECEQDSPVVQDVFAKTFLKVFETLVAFFETAQKQGIVEKGLDAQVLVICLFGTLTHFAKTGLMRRRYFKHSIHEPRYRKKVARDIHSLFLHGVVADGTLSAGGRRTHP